MCYEIISVGGETFFTEGQMQRMLYTFLNFRSNLGEWRDEEPNKNPITSLLQCVPNPTNSYFELLLPDVINELKNITVYNHNGQLIMHKKVVINQGITVDASLWSSGLYWIVIDNNAIKLMKL